MPDGSGVMAVLIVVVTPSRQDRSALASLSGPTGFATTVTLPLMPASANEWWKREECGDRTKIDGLLWRGSILRRFARTDKSGALAMIISGFFDNGTIFRPYQFVRKFLTDPSRNFPFLASIGSIVGGLKLKRPTSRPLISLRNNDIDSSVSRNSEVTAFGVAGADVSFGISRRSGKVTLTSRGLY